MGNLRHTDKTEILKGHPTFYLDQQFQGISWHASYSKIEGDVCVYVYACVCFLVFVCVIKCTPFHVEILYLEQTSAS